MVVCAVHQIVSFSLLRSHSKMYTFAELHMQVHMLALSKKKKKKREKISRPFPVKALRASVQMTAFSFASWNG